MNLKSDDERLCACTAVAIVNASADHIFMVASGPDIERYFSPAAGLPGVASSTGDVVAWNAPGQQRHIILTDGATLIETLTDFDPPFKFAYRVDFKTGPLASLAEHAESRWRFRSTEDKTTEIRWRYIFTPHSLFGRLALPFVAKLAMARYMRAVLERIKAAAEKT